MSNNLLAAVNEVDALFKQSFAAVPPSGQMQQGPPPGAEGMMPPGAAGPPMAVDPATGQPVPVDPATGAPMAAAPAPAPVAPAGGIPPEEMAILLTTMSERMQRLEQRLDHSEELRKVRDEKIQGAALGG